VTRTRLRRIAWHDWLIDWHNWFVEARVTMQAHAAPPNVQADFLRYSPQRSATPGARNAADFYQEPYQSDHKDQGTNVDNERQRLHSEYVGPALDAKVQDPQRGRRTKRYQKQLPKAALDVFPDGHSLRCYSRSVAEANL
jgi:hypothetical protein